MVFESDRYLRERAIEYRANLQRMNQLIDSLIDERWRHRTRRQHCLQTLRMLWIVTGEAPSGELRCGFNLR